MDLRQILVNYVNLWPPFLFGGIKIIHRSADYRHMIVKLKLRFWNANVVGTQFGGLLFAMTDPFYMLMLIKNLGDEYIIWDKSALIEYLKPGRTDVTAEFILTNDDLEQVKQTVENEGKMLWTKIVEIKDREQNVIAKVTKVIHIRRKEKKDA